MHAGNGMPASRAALGITIFPSSACARGRLNGINITKRGKIQLASTLVFAETVTSITMHVLVR